MPDFSLELLIGKVTLRTTEWTQNFSCADQIQNTCAKSFCADSLWSFKKLKSPWYVSFLICSEVVMVSKWLYYETWKIACSDPPKRVFILFHFHGSICQEHLGYSTCLSFIIYFCINFWHPWKRQRTATGIIIRHSPSLNVDGVPTPE